MKMSSFTHPHVVPNLNEFFSSVELKYIYMYLLKNVSKQSKTSIVFYFLQWQSV